MKRFTHQHRRVTQAILPEPTVRLIQIEVLIKPDLMLNPTCRWLSVWIYLGDKGAKNINVWMVFQIADLLFYLVWRDAVIRVQAAKIFSPTESVSLAIGSAAPLIRCGGNDSDTLINKRADNLQRIIGRAIVTDD